MPMTLPETPAAGDVTVLADGGTYRYNGTNWVLDTSVPKAPVARTATAAGLTTGTIAAGTEKVLVTSANADHIIILPAPVVGHVVQLINGATGYELRSSAPATIGINGGTGADAESAIAASTIVTCTCQSMTNWVCMSQVAAGTVSATQVAA